MKIFSIALNKIVEVDDELKFKYVSNEDGIFINDIHDDCIDFFNNEEVSNFYNDYTALWIPIIGVSDSWGYKYIKNCNHN